MAMGEGPVMAKSAQGRGADLAIMTRAFSDVLAILEQAMGDVLVHANSEEEVPSTPEGQGTTTVEENTPTKLEKLDLGEAAVSKSGVDSELKKLSGKPGLREGDGAGEIEELEARLEKLRDSTTTWAAKLASWEATGAKETDVKEARSRIARLERRVRKLEGKQRGLGVSGPDSSGSEYDTAEEVGTMQVKELLVAEQRWEMVARHTTIMVKRMQAVWVAQRRTTILRMAVTMHRRSTVQEHQHGAGGKAGSAALGLQALDGVDLWIAMGAKKKPTRKQKHARAGTARIRWQMLAAMRRTTQQMGEHNARTKLLLAAGARWRTGEERAAERWQQVIRGQQKVGRAGVVRTARAVMARARHQQMLSGAGVQTMGRVAAPAWLAKGRGAEEDNDMHRKWIMLEAMMWQAQTLPRRVEEMSDLLLAAMDWLDDDMLTRWREDEASDSEESYDTTGSEGSGEDDGGPLGDDERVANLWGAAMPAAKGEVEWGWQGTVDYGYGRGSYRQVNCAEWCRVVQYMARMRVILAEQGRPWRGEEVTEVIIETMCGIGTTGAWPWDDAKEMAKYSESVAGSIMGQGREQEVRETSQWGRAGMLEKSLRELRWDKAAGALVNVLTELGVDAKAFATGLERGEMDWFEEERVARAAEVEARLAAAAKKEARLAAAAEEEARLAAQTTKEEERLATAATRKQKQARAGKARARWQMWENIIWLYNKRTRPLLEAGARAAEEEARLAAAAKKEARMAAAAEEEARRAAAAAEETNMPLPSGDKEEAARIVSLPSGAPTKTVNDERLAAAAEEEARLAAQTTAEEARRAAAAEVEARLAAAAAGEKARLAEVARMLPKPRPAARTRSKKAGRYVTPLSSVWPWVKDA